MDLLELIKSRRAVRDFIPKELNEQTLGKILEAGRYAPSPLNCQPWHFTLIRNKESLKHLAHTAQYASFLSKAELLIIVTINKKIEIDNWLIQHNQHLFSGAAAMQNMWLVAWSLKIGCCWVTLDEITTRKQISIPDDQEVIGALALGYVDENASKSPEAGERNPLCLMTSFEQFGKREDCEKESHCACLKLIPKSAAMSPEGEDYIKYFCGQECYVAWKKQTKKWLGDKSNNEFELDGTILTTRLLLHVARGEQDEAEQLLKEAPSLLPELLSQTGDVVDYAGRIFKDVTAFQVAVWNKDTHMARMLLQCVPEGNAGLATRKAMLEQVVTLKKTGITFAQHDNTIIASSHQYNMQPLIDKLKYYADNYKAWVAAENWLEIEKIWCKEIGALQANLPACLIQRYCTGLPFYPPPTFASEDVLERSSRIYNYIIKDYENLLPFRTSAPILGVDFAIIRRGPGRELGSKEPVARGTRMAGGRRVALDSLALIALDAARLADGEEILTSLTRACTSK